MTIQNRVTLRLASVLLVSLVWMTGVLHYEWVEQQRRLLIERKSPESAWQESGEIVLSYGIPTAIVLLAAGWWLLRKSISPVITLTQAVERIHIRNLNDRLPVTGSGDEIDRLTVVFNSMMNRLDASFQQIQVFTLHASHELKTPLTIMRAEVETALREEDATPAVREMFASQLEEIARLTRIVDSLALLAKADAGKLGLIFEPVALDVLVRESFADAQILAQQSGLTVELATCDPVVVQGDRHRLRQLLLNLTDNAIKYNQPGGRVRFSLRRDSGDAELTIANTGPGIGAGEMSRVFDRFYRGSRENPSIEGSGLGLSIAESIVQAHHGRIQLQSEQNQLTVVKVWLPEKKHDFSPD